MHIFEIFEAIILSPRRRVTHRSRLLLSDYLGPILVIIYDAIGNSKFSYEESIPFKQLFDKPHYIQKNISFLLFKHFFFK